MRAHTQYISSAQRRLGVARGLGVGGGSSCTALQGGTLLTTLGEETLTKTMMGASEVLASWAGWLMVSASNTTNCRDLANSNIRSISLCTSAGKAGSSGAHSGSHCSPHQTWRTPQGCKGRNCGERCRE